MPNVRFSAGEGVRLPRALIPRASIVQGLLAGTLTALAASGCSAAMPSPSPAPPLTVDRATPSSAEPAAGICGSVDGHVVQVFLHPDVPDPRCVVIRSDQVLEVLNDDDTPRRIVLGQFRIDLAAGETAVLDLEFGGYLAQGVHQVQAEPCCGPALWLKDG